MATQSFIVLTSAERTAAVALNNENGGVDPRAVDNELAGHGINTNPAASVAVGAGVDLTGKYVVPTRVLNDPENDRFDAVLGPLPRCILDVDVIFAPVVEF